MWLRQVIVPNYNDDQLEKMGEFLAKFNHVNKVRVLPYHNYAGSKYKSLDIKNMLPELLPTDMEIKSAKETIEAHRIRCC